MDSSQKVVKNVASVRNKMEEAAAHTIGEIVSEVFIEVFQILLERALGIVDINLAPFRRRSLRNNHRHRNWQCHTRLDLRQSVKR